MSIESLGIISSLAGSPLAQKAPEADKLPKDATDRARQSDAETRAENAAGIGQMEEDSEASERDADGRRPWELPQRTVSDDEAAGGSIANDLTGKPGGLLDISG